MAEVESGERKRREEKVRERGQCNSLPRSHAVKGPNGPLSRGARFRHAICRHSLHIFRFGRKPVSH